MEATLLWTLRQLYHSLERQGRQSMRELELSLGQAIVLCWLLSQKGEHVCAADLHKALGLSKSALSSTLKELQAKQYLLTVETPEDDRKKVLVLTARAFATASAGRVIFSLVVDSVTFSKSPSGISSRILRSSAAGFPPM